MAVRKKKKSASKHVRVPFPVLLSNVLVLAAILGLSYMRICARCDALGKEIKQKESVLANAEKRLMNEQDRWSNLTSPSGLERAIRRHGLNMVMPSEQQIVRVRLQQHQKITFDFAMQ